MGYSISPQKQDFLSFHKLQVVHIVIRHGEVKNVEAPFPLPQTQHVRDEDIIIYDENWREGVSSFCMHLFLQLFCI